MIPLTHDIDHPRRASRGPASYRPLALALIACALGAVYLVGLVFG